MKQKQLARSGKTRYPLRTLCDKCRVHSWTSWYRFGCCQKSLPDPPYSRRQAAQSYEDSNLKQSLRISYGEQSNWLIPFFWSRYYSLISHNF